MFAECLGHVGGDGDVDVLDKAVLPEGEISDFILFAGEGVFDVDHAALRLFGCMSG